MLHNCKSSYGRTKLNAENTLAKQIQEYIANPPLKTYMQKQFDYRYGNLDLTDPLKHKRYRSIKSIYKMLCECMVDDSSLWQNKEAVGLAMMVSNPKKKLGDIELGKINTITINSLIKELLKTRKKISVVSYLSFLSNMFEDLKYINVNFTNFVNPCKNYDKKLLKNSIERTAKSIPNDIIEKIVIELSKCKNKNHKKIFILCLATGMRRSECIFLKRNQIHSNYIELFNTKTEAYRKVILTAEAQEIVKSILEAMLDKSPNARLFASTTINQFEKSFSIIQDRLGIKGKYKFHDTRKTHIKNMFMQLGNNPMLISQVLGFSSPEKLMSNHNERSEEIKTEQDLMQNAGQTPRISLKHYLDITG